MSSKANRVAKGLPQTSEPAGKTAVFRVDAELVDEKGLAFEKSTVVRVTGIPVDLKKEEYTDLAKHAAETQFYNALNQRTFFEWYSLGKTAKDEYPTFKNLTKVTDITIKNVELIEEQK